MWIISQSVRYRDINHTGSPSCSYSKVMEISKHNPVFLDSDYQSVIKKLNGDSGKQSRYQFEETATSAYGQEKTSI
jgi:hypothetical protein